MCRALGAVLLHLGVVWPAPSAVQTMGKPPRLQGAAGLGLPPAPVFPGGLHPGAPIPGHSSHRQQLQSRPCTLLALTLQIPSLLPDGRIKHWDIPSHISSHSKLALHWDCWDSSLHRQQSCLINNLFSIFCFSHGSFLSWKKALELNWIYTEMQEVSIFFLVLCENCHPIPSVCLSCVELHPPPSQGELILHIVVAAGRQEKTFTRY